MPCYDSETHERPKRLEQKIHYLTELLCQLCTEINKTSPDYFSFGHLSKGITGPNAKATVHSQFNKLLEEVSETGTALSENDQDEIVDWIGDCTVVLILLADLAGVKFESCLESAYNEIKGRTGFMSADGMFIKDTPKDDFDEPLPERTCTDGEVCESCQ